MNFFNNSFQHQAFCTLKNRMTVQCKAPLGTGDLPQESEALQPYQEKASYGPRELQYSQAESELDPTTPVRLDATTGGGIRLEPPDHPAAALSRNNVRGALEASLPPGQGLALLQEMKVLCDQEPLQAHLLVH